MVVSPSWSVCILVLLSSECVFLSFVLGPLQSVFEKSSVFALVLFLKFWCSRVVGRFVNFVTSSCDPALFTADVRSWRANFADLKFQLSKHKSILGFVTCLQVVASGTIERKSVWDWQTCVEFLFSPTDRLVDLTFPYFRILCLVFLVDPTFAWIWKFDLSKSFKFEK